MQAGSGGRRKLLVVSSQFLVRSRQRLFVLGSASFRCDAKGVVSSQFLVKGESDLFFWRARSASFVTQRWTGRIVHSAEVRRNAEFNYARPSSLSRGADEIPLAPGERFVQRQKMSAGNVLDEFGLAEPLVVGAAFELNHGGQRIHLVRNAARQGIL